MPAHAGIQSPGAPLLDARSRIKLRENNARPQELAAYDGPHALAEHRGLWGNAVYTDSRVVEHGGALRSRVALGQPFERVVHDIIGVRHLVDWEVTFEHAAVGTELLDTILHQGGQRLGQIFRANGPGAFMPVKAKPAL